MNQSISRWESSTYLQPTVWRIRSKIFDFPTSLDLQPALPLPFHPFKSSPFQLKQLSKCKMMNKEAVFGSLVLDDFLWKVDYGEIWGKVFKLFSWLDSILRVWWVMIKSVKNFQISSQTKFWFFLNSSHNSSLPIQFKSLLMEFEPLFITEFKGQGLNTSLPPPFHMSTRVHLCLYVISSWRKSWNTFMAEAARECNLFKLWKGWR